MLFASPSTLTQFKAPAGTPGLPPGVTTIPITPNLIQLAQVSIADGYWRQSASLGFGWEVPHFKHLRLDVNATYAYDGVVNIGTLPIKNDGRIFTGGLGMTWTFN